MKEEEKIICSVIYEFVNINWDKITHDKVEIKKSKEQFLGEVMEDFQTAMWVLTEVCVWGMDKRDYLKELYVELSDDCDFTVLKIGDRFIKCVMDRGTYIYSVSFVSPKTKMVYYFE